MAVSDAELKRRINNYFERIPVRWDYRPIADGLIDIGREYLGQVHDYPVSFACAIAQWESWGRVIFGCDAGSIFCQEEVTRERVDRLIRHVRGGGASNGVGIGQPTYFPLILQGEEMGGIHIPRNQMIVSFRHMRDMVRAYGYYGGVGAYNAGPGGRWSVRWTYTSGVESYHNDWIRRLT